MHIYIDADACPVVGIAEDIATKIQHPGNAALRYEPCPHI